MRAAQFIKLHRLPLCVILAALGLGCAGCATDKAEPDNLSSRPWNSPEGWQNGNIPSSMLQPR
jgi:hypothetical protein